MASCLTVTRPDIIGKLPQLQNMIKRDPQGYKAEFLMQFRHYESEYQLFLLQPSKDPTHFSSLITFLGHVATCYPDLMEAFPEQLITLLKDHFLLLNAHLRKTLVQSLMLLRNRKLLDPIPLLKVFFQLFQCPDKRLRDMVYHNILTEIRSLNLKSRNVKVNQALQSFLREKIQRDNEQAALQSLKILIDLYRSEVWNDARTVNIIAMACSSKKTKIMVLALQFFLGMECNISEDGQTEKKKQKELVKIDYHLHSKKTKKRYRDTRNALVKNRQIRKREDTTCNVAFPAIELINDPQGIAEKQFSILKSSVESFENKLLMMNFIARVIGFHKLILLPFYSLLQRYLNSNQQNITNILAYLVQASHSDIPPEELVAVVKSIAGNFITDRCSSDVIAIGINTLRELFKRVPLLLECQDMDVIIADLIMYNKSKDKSIVMAARGVLNLIRVIHPTVLQRKFRGKFYDTEMKPKAFGELVALEGIDGSDLLAEAEASGRFDPSEEVPNLVPISEHSSSDDSSDDDEICVEFVEGDDHQSEMQCSEHEAVAQEPSLAQKDRIEARRILSSTDFERIAILKKERDAQAQDPKLRARKRKNISDSNVACPSTFISPDDLEGHAKRTRMTQEERLRSILKGREEFQHKQSNGGTTNTEKERHKHFMMIKKSRRVQSKVLQSARMVQRSKNQTVKKQIMKQKKRRKF